MGGAASAHAEIEQMVACTFLLGQALSRQFPEIYTVNDFHANKEKLHRQMQKEHERNMAKMCKSMPMVFLGPDGTVTPVQFVDEDGNPMLQDDIDSEEGGNQQEGNQADQDKQKEEEEDDVPLEECLVVEFQGREVPLKLDDIATVNNDGWNVLHAACHQMVTVDIANRIIDIFVENGHDLEVKTKRGPGSYASEWTALHIACAYGIVPTVKALVEAGANVNTTNSIGWSPLHEAVHRGFVEIVDILLEHDANATKLIPSSMLAPYHPQYPLAHACRQGHLQVVKSLLKHGVNKDAQNDGGWTALHESVFFRHEEIVKTLLVHGCDCSLTTTQGYTVTDFDTTQGIRAAILEVLPDSQRKKLQDPSDEGKEDDRQRDNEDGNDHNNNNNKKNRESKEISNKEKPVYRLLGDLPDFKQHSFMQTVNSAPVETEHDDEDDEEARRQRIQKRKELRKKRSKTKLQGIAPADEGVPVEYACQLTGKLMVDPVTTIYGNHFEKTALVAWLRSQGNICPVTGQPLSESEAIIDKDLRIEINDWQLKQAISSEEKPSDINNAKAHNASAAGGGSSGITASGDDELYDF